MLKAVLVLKLPSLSIAIGESLETRTPLEDRLNRGTMSRLSLVRIVLRPLLATLAPSLQIPIRKVL